MVGSCTLREGLINMLHVCCYVKLSTMRNFRRLDDWLVMTFEMLTLCAPSANLC